ncbi:MAG: hypothetical protein A2885_13365 [Sphingopyxis sp. RIFCSPHIGHO2_01_FULL_65_24]|nr:MAG: hypothetical protein A2885_13365 [Sphingopyxis sp. RIFCSPHIGHO2_01_FULL_65_24]
MIQPSDLMFLAGRPEFRRFLFSAIQLAGITSPANGHETRDLAFSEGRRSLGLELLQLADQGQPEALRTPHALATLNAALMEAMNPPSKPKEKPRDRYDDIPD